PQFAALSSGYGIATRRQRMQDMTSAAPLPEGTKTATVDAGGVPGEWVEAPGGATRPTTLCPAGRGLHGGVHPDASGARRAPGRGDPRPGPHGRVAGGPAGRRRAAVCRPAVLHPRASLAAG